MIYTHLLIIKKYIIVYIIIWRFIINKTMIIEDLDSITYAMSDEELFKLYDNLLKSNIKKHGYANISEITNEEFERINEFDKVLPLSKKVINSLVHIGYSREHLEQENRELYAKQEWKKYL